MISINLSGKTALVTGGGQGLGKSTVQVLHRAGANVVVNFFPDTEGTNKARAEETVRELGSRALALPADVRKSEEVEKMFDAAIQHFGALDIVVNNAAVLKDRSIRKMTDAEWSAVIDTNLTGTFNVCRSAAAKLTDGGRIVNMASIAGVMGIFGQANYSSAKAGVIALTKVLSKELARRKITVNAVAPGVVLTEMGKSILEEARTEMLKVIPFGRFAEPEEISNPILFLCSPLADYVTGQTLHVNGGWWAA